MNRTPLPSPFALEDVPAVVLTRGRQAVVLHSAGPGHENAKAARARLSRRGFAVIPVPADLTPFLREAPVTVGIEARRILAGGSQ